MRISAPCACTMANSVAAFAGDRRMQPCEAGLPSAPTAFVPWIAYIGRKKIECGIGALLYLAECTMAYSRCGWNTPRGVGWPSLPDETGQSKLAPSVECTCIVCDDRSTSMVT